MLELISFICGFSVMVFEISGIRILTPFIGSTFITSTTIIGILLFALSIGYYFGGKWADKSLKSEKLGIIILISATYIALSAVCQFKLLKYITYNVQTSIYIKSIISSLALFFIPSLLLGAVSPYITKLAISNTNFSNQKTGELIGKFYAISTIGSIIGTFLSGFVLIIYFGIDKIFLFLSSTLSLASFLCFFTGKNFTSKQKMFYYFIILALNFFSFFLYNSFFKFPVSILNGTIYSKTTPYSYLTVVNNENNLYLRADIYGYHTVVNRNEKITQNSFDFEDYNNIFKEIYLEKFQNNRILILGNGAGKLSNWILQRNKNLKKERKILDIIEIDKEVINIAKKYFGMTTENANIFYEDARTYVNNSQKVKKDYYDIIYSDLYISGFISPFYLMTKEFFSDIYNLTSENGILCINVIGSTQGIYKDYLEQFYTQINSVYSDTKVYAFSPSKYISNYIIIGFKNPTSQESLKLKKALKSIEYNNINLKNQIYTNMYAPVEKFYVPKSF